MHPGLISFLLHITSFHCDSPGADKIKLTELFCTTIKLWNSAFRHLFCTSMGIWHCTKSEIFNNKNADLVFDNLDLTHFPQNILATIWLESAALERAGSGIFCCGQICTIRRFAQIHQPYFGSELQGNAVGLNLRNAFCAFCRAQNSAAFLRPIWINVEFCWSLRGFLALSISDDKFN